MPNFSLGKLPLIGKRRDRWLIVAGEAQRVAAQLSRRPKLTPRPMRGEKGAKKMRCICNGLLQVLMERIDAGRKVLTVYGCRRCLKRYEWKEVIDT